MANFNIILNLLRSKITISPLFSYLCGQGLHAIGWGQASGSDISLLMPSKYFHLRKDAKWTLAVPSQIRNEELEIRPHPLRCSMSWNPLLGCLPVSQLTNCDKIKAPLRDIMATGGCYSKFVKLRLRISGNQSYRVASIRASKIKLSRFSIDTFLVY